MFFIKKNSGRANCFESNLFFFILVLWFVVSTIIIGVGVGILQEFFGYETKTWQLAMSTQIISLLLPVIVYFIVTKRNPIEVLSLKILNSKSVFYVLLISFLIQPIMMLLSGLSGLFFNNDIAEIIDALGEESFLLGLIAIAVIPATVEEIVMRGVVLNGYKKQKMVVSCVVGGLLFGIMHLNAQQFLYAFFAGAVFSALVLVTGSLFAAILGHVVINATQFSLAQLTTLIDTSELLLEEEVTTSITTFIPLIIVSAILLPIIYVLIKKLKGANTEFISEEIVLEADDYANDKKDRWFNWPIIAAIIVYVLFIVGQSMLINAILATA